jgi:hypothetical protein
MRLINTQYLKLQEFYDTQVPPYAIVSHRWRDDELPFHDYSELLSVPYYQYLYGDPQEKLSKVNDPDSDCYIKRGGVRKIISACLRAFLDGIGHVWIDTVGIDKSSSAELQEAINSMYAWYERSRICYVYLDDVSCPVGTHRTDAELEQALSASEWQTRSWTLQEFLAPTRVDFYDNKWLYLGSKLTTSIGARGFGTSELSVKNAAFSRMTGVPLEAVERLCPLREYSIAQRFSWAARRQSTRLEDRAYSLMGIFDVNMPMLYGEGAKAFRRLQEEIIKQNLDHSILVWDGTQTGRTSNRSIFAPSLDCFAESGNIISLRTHRSPMELTNAGLRVSLPMITINATPNAQRCLALLDCRIKDEITKIIALELETANKEEAGEAWRDAYLSHHTYSVVESQRAAESSWQHFMITETRFFLSKRDLGRSSWLWLVRNRNSPVTVVSNFRPRRLWLDTLALSDMGSGALQKASTRMAETETPVSFEIAYRVLRPRATVTIQRCADRFRMQLQVLDDGFGADQHLDDDTPGPPTHDTWQDLPAYASRSIPGSPWILHVLIDRRQIINEEVMITHVYTTKRAEARASNQQNSEKDVGRAALEALLDQLPVESRRC